MRTFHFTVTNTDAWAITNREIIVVAEDKVAAKKALKLAGYDNLKTSALVELKDGVHVIQTETTE